MKGTHGGYIFIRYTYLSPEAGKVVPNSAYVIAPEMLKIDFITSFCDDIYYDLYIYIYVTHVTAKVTVTFRIMTAKCLNFWSYQHHIGYLPNIDIIPPAAHRIRDNPLDPASCITPVGLT